MLIFAAVGFLDEPSVTLLGMPSGKSDRAGITRESGQFNCRYSVSVGAGPVPARYPGRGTKSSNISVNIAPYGASGWHGGLPLHW